MLSIYRNMFKIPDLRVKILFTLFIFAVYRLGTAIPVPGIDLDAVQLFQEQQQQGGIYGLINLFSGGALEQFSVFALGIIPYITAQCSGAVAASLTSLTSRRRSSCSFSRW